MKSYLQFKYLVLGAFFTVICSVDGFAQHTVTGTVTDASSTEALPGVNILVKGSANGTTTDAEGFFELTTSSDDTLVFSYIGYRKQEVPIQGRSEINISLQSQTFEGEDLVVVGYGTQTEGELTSSVSSVKAEDFKTGNVSDAGELIQGKIAGLTVTTPSGDPTSGSEIRLRGNTTLFGANSDPLVLIDGVPGSLDTVAPENIQSIDVLKDGSAAAIYGTRGSNGVILVTTKQASGQYNSSFEYSAHVSTQTIASELDLLEASDYRRQIENGIRDESWDLGNNTNWMDEITRTPISHVHNLTYRGGDQQTNYLASINYRDEEGTFIKSDNENLRFRAEVNHSMFDDKVNVNLGVLTSSNTFTSTGDGTSFNGWTYRQAVIRNPTAPVKAEDGSWFEQPGIFEYENPLALLYESTGEINNENTRLNGSVIYDPVQNLSLKATLSYNTFNQTRGYAESKDHISTIRDGLNGYASNGSQKGNEKLLELTAEYTNSFDRHDITVLGGYSYQENIFRDYWMQNWNFPTDEFTYNNIGIGKAIREGLAPIYSGKQKTNLIGFFGRANYNYDNRYLLMGSLRYEGASQLYGTEDPWGLFPAISAGWRISNEAFMENVNFIDDLKLRVGYGVTGTQPADLFLGVGQLGYQDYVYTNGEWNRTLTPIQNANPDLRWEEKHELNFGLDFTILNDMVSGNIDYYIRDIEGLLYDYSVPSPPNLYPTTRANAAEMRNEGIEALLEINPVRNENFSWTTSFNFSTNSNELVSLSNELYETTNDYFTTGATGPPAQTFTHIVQVDHPIGDFYGYKVIDVDENGEWIYENSEGEAVPYDDFSHSFENKQRLGNGLPNYYAGWNNTFRYKNFDLSISMRGAFDYQILNFQRMYHENTGRVQYNRLESAYDEVFGKAMLSGEMPVEFNSYYIEDGDYWKIDNITLGYRFPTASIKYVNSARIYVSSLNTLTITGYDGIDPEVSSDGLDPGIDNRDKYPTMRTFTLGVNVNF